MSKKKIFKILYILIIFFPCFEIALRLAGVKPYIQKDYSINATPKNAFIGDSILGIALNPGKYEITLNNEITFIAKHLKNGRREVPITDSLSNLKVAFFGCSFTYGYGVNDDENFVAKLQSIHPEYQFQNYGVIGYGTIQSYLQLKQLIIENNIPKQVFLVFSSYHLSRNVLSPEYRRALKIGYTNAMNNLNSLMGNSKFPYSIDESQVTIKYRNWKNMYFDWKGRNYFSTINFLQTKWDAFKENRIDKVLVSLAIINEMNTICIKNGVKFNLIILDSTSSTEQIIQECKKMNVNIVKVEFNFSDSTITNLPFDMHPNKLGHGKIADVINQQIVW